MPEELTQQLWSIGGKQNDVVGPDIASVAGLIAPTYLMHRVTGVAAITGITIPHTDFEGLFIAIPTGTWTWTTATNIALAGTAVVGKCIIFVYSKKTSKWYPSVIA